MVFKFIRYTQPSWQLNIYPSAAKGSFASCYIQEDKVPDGFIDTRYQTKSAQLGDAGYHLCLKGMLLEATTEQIKQQQHLPPPTLKDEYTFIRKYWGTPWAAFALLLRLITLKNVFKELLAFVSTRAVKRINSFQNPFIDENYNSFQSQLVSAEPLVAVVIPTLNRYSYLKDVLNDLEKQLYKNFEVLVFDQSDNFNQQFYNQFALTLKVHNQKEKLLWTARNNAIKATSAEYLLFFDDDSRVNEHWIAEHLKCIDYYNVDISAGVSLATMGQKIPPSYNYFRWADQFDSGNAMVKRPVFKHIGLFDEQFNGQRMGDAEFGYRAYVNGFKSISNPNAPRVHLKVSSGGLREMGSWDGFRPKKWFAPKPVPSVIYLYKKYLSQPLYKNAVLIGIMLSNVPYKHKRSSKMLALSIALTVLKLPVLLIQFYRSKKIAAKMLGSGKTPEMLK